MLTVFYIAPHLARRRPIDGQGKSLSPIAETQKVQWNLVPLRGEGVRFGAAFWGQNQILITGRFPVQSFGS